LVFFIIGALLVEPFLNNAPRHSENGSDPSRVRAILLSEQCVCERKGCFKKFRQVENDLMIFLEQFWSLEKPAQDAFDPHLVEKNQEHCFQLILKFGIFRASTPKKQTTESSRQLRSKASWMEPRRAIAAGSFWATKFLGIVWQNFSGSDPSALHRHHLGIWIGDIDVLAPTLSF